MDSKHVDLEAGLAMCADACAGAGHQLHPIQRAVVAGAPSSWVDGLAFSSHGLIEFVTLDGTPTRLWHHREVELEAGEPVAYHPVAGVLTVRGTVLNIRVAA